MDRSRRQSGAREIASIDQSRLLPGFLEVGDLKSFKDREAILSHLKQVMPDAGQNRLKNFAAQLNQFAHTIKVGDLVVMPRKVTNGVAIGEVKGDYTYNPDDPYRHSRSVKWLEVSVPRDDPA